jgi:peptidoglycan hydrolase-like protein with peptidoglycan-binding domain
VPSSSRTTAPSKGRANGPPSRRGGENVLYVPVKKSELSQLAQAQQMLTELGYDPGPVDGIMGPMTGGALRRFQQDQSLPVTGQPDAATMAKLKELTGK